MLDDLKMIHQRDGQDALGGAGKQWQQLGHEFATENFEAWSKVDHIYNVVHAGMSTSAFGADLVKAWSGIGEPFEVVRGYDIPGYVDGDTLFVACSFSGTTEETLSALDQAERQGAVIAVISAGGKLVDIARSKGYPLVLLPSDGQSRFASWMMARAVLRIFDAAGLTQNKAAELAAQADWLHEQLDAWRPDIPVKQNVAKQIALELLGKTVIVYAGSKLYPAALRWKTSINENAKQLAWSGQFPEFNHNEFMSWTRQPVQKPFVVVELRSGLEHARVQQRFELSERLLSGMRPAPHVIEPAGETLLQQLLYATALGDMVSVYTALLNGLNPSALELVDKFKQELGRYEA